MYWLLAREVLRLRGSIQRQTPWNVMVDMFFYRDPEETEKDAEAGAIAPAEKSAYGGDYGADNVPEWGAEGNPEVIHKYNIYIYVFPLF